jgi:cell fate (sporulation/competence/biofilm development) regulator YlbF (YheA/YmcA/DUF963 family)
MQAIIELATRLGRAIAESPQATKLRAAKEELNHHADLTATLKDYSAQAEKIAKLEAENKPLEVEDKHRLDKLESKLLSHEVFKRYTASQMDYVDLMRHVNAELRKQLAAVEE